MSAHYNDSIDQGHPDNNLHTTSFATTYPGQDTMSSLELSVDLGNSEITLCIVHKPALEQPIMTTRTRSASFSESEYGSEYFSAAENFSDMDDPEIFPEGAPVATGVSNTGSNGKEKEASENSRDWEKGFESEHEESSQESFVSSAKEDATEPLGVTLARHAIGGTIQAGINPTIISPPSPSLPSANRAQRMPSTTNLGRLIFFKEPEPSYVLHENKNEVTVYLTDDVTLKFFSVESEEIEDAIGKLPTIAPKLRSLIKKAEWELSQAVNCLMWDLSGKKLNKIPEPQEMGIEADYKYVSLLGLRPHWS